MKADRELLELAAKAAEFTFNNQYYDQEQGLLVWTPPTNYESVDWNPLRDDGDALRLAIALHIGIKSNGPDHWQEPSTSIALYEVGELGGRILVRHGDDPPHSTRLAIVRAAAAIGEAM